MSALLEMQGIDTGHDRLQVLWKTDLRVDEGEAVVLLGANGAGKTTLLRTLVGLHPLWGGSIHFAGEDIARLPSARRIRAGIAYMSELGVFPDLSIADNLALGGYFLSAAERRTQRRQMFERFPDLARRPRAAARSLSGGQRKMLGVAKALMGRPRLLVMDEPSAGLSPKFVNEVIDILRHAGGDGLAMLIAEQNVRFLDLADRGVVLDGGRVAAEGPVAALKQDDAVRRAYFGMLAAEG
ncbi:ABC transporter ATP-binding protein [Acidihalobacter yilgarnensis]|uniref:ABC transporter ATP-binding protein n=1 Tax=Acidihalobacter yilgarnensis TaxID=2819280 RepID=A0A1D8IS29_9GAMM|nr:ABC transporter ATP-binding protein [Acidihalobacter yilgarnensis]AOU99217.1 ABC transporter ATP-binding protein [Acidihalobacter yilgarnensis]